jgi:hypothetical protein
MRCTLERVKPVAWHASCALVQNVHAMRPEVRAEFEAARAVVSGDDAFAVRLERFFTELRDPLVALYGSDPRFVPAWRTLLQATRGPRRSGLVSYGGSTTSVR